MEALKAYFRSPDLWVGGIIIGAIINILASYGKDGIDKWRARWSAKRREKYEADQQEVRRHIAEMVHSQDELDEARQEELRLRWSLIPPLMCAIVLALITTASVGYWHSESAETVLGINVGHISGVLFTFLLLTQAARSHHDANLLKWRITSAVMQRKALARSSASDASL